MTLLEKNAKPAYIGAELALLRRKKTHLAASAMCPGKQRLCRSCWSRACSDKEVGGECDAVDCSTLNRSFRSVVVHLFKIMNDSTRIRS